MTRLSLIAGPIALQPNNDHLHTSLGHALLAKMDLDGAAAAYRQAVALRPDAVEAYNNLGVVLKEQGRLEEALDCCDKALAIAPNSAAIHSNRIYLLSFHPGYDPASLAREQRKWNEQHARPLQSSIRPHDNDRSPDRRLRIGYVSPDFRQHVVGQNIFPLLSQHDREGFEVYCYSSVAKPDAFTQVLRPHADVWRNVASRTDEDLAQTVREDQIDILVDLSLHMAHNRLLVFARKPAPVQVTYLGYCASTGLEAMDYRLSDPYLDPPDSDLSCYSERTIRLPETYWCYGPAGPTPDPSPPPAAAGYITFGCLNNFAKASWTALDLWAQVLQAVANSRMIIHSYPGSHLDEVRERFATGGVAARPPGIRRQATVVAICRHVRTDRHRPGPAALGRRDHHMRCAVDGRAGGESRGRDRRGTRRKEHPVEPRPGRAGRPPPAAICSDRLGVGRVARSPGRASPHASPADAHLAADERAAIRAECGKGLSRNVAAMVCFPALTFLENFSPKRTIE